MRWGCGPWMLSAPWRVCVRAASGTWSSRRTCCTQRNTAHQSRTENVRRHAAGGEGG